MKSIFLSDSDEEAILELVKQQRELMTVSKTSRRKNDCVQLATTKNWPVKTVKKWFKTQYIKCGKLTQTKSGQAAASSTEQQTRLKDSFSFL